MFIAQKAEIDISAKGFLPVESTETFNTRTIMAYITDRKFSILLQKFIWEEFHCT